MKTAPPRKPLVFPEILWSLCVVTFLFTAAVTVILNLKWLYYADIKWLDLEAVSGMTAEQIRENYDVLIRYNRLWYRGALVFPSLKMSESGRIHFAEVKRIFDLVQILCIVSGLGTLAAVIWHRKRERYLYLKLAGLIGLIAPIVLGVLAAVNWDRFFVTFHHVFFRNDYWLFDPAEDPVIRILPDTYFLQCAAGILILIAVGCIVCLVRYRKRQGSIVVLPFTAEDVWKKR